nr:metal ABC transporter substrate-binding protein [uncultured Anaerobutyricum sp.]
MKRLFKKRRMLSASSLLLTSLFLCLFLSVGCSVIKNNAAETPNIFVNEKKDNNAEEDVMDKISIVCTTFPQYDWVKNIIGNQEKRFDITLLLDNGVDMHSYQPTIRDIAIAGSGDLFIYVGGESDAWVRDALKEAKNKDLKAINLMDVLGNSVKEEEVVEGMQEGKGFLGHSHKEEEEADDVEEEPEYDEHIWLSIRNAKILVKNIAQEIANINAQNAEIYEKNADSYIKKLDHLDKQYAATIKNGKYKAILFGDRFPFRYLADDYQLKYYAAFVGCSAETMAGFETVTFLAQKIDTLHLPDILTIENSDGRIAESIKANTAKKDQDILVMNSLQSITNEQLLEGITYLKVMRENLSVLSKALN